MFRGWLKFNLVGVAGMATQLTVLRILTKIDVEYLVATAIAVEAAIVQNFLWHERFTWKERSVEPTLSQRFLRFFRFNIANGAVSLTGNVALMYLLTGRLGIPVLLANLLSIGACSLINFLLGDRFVFRHKGPRV